MKFNTNCSKIDNFAQLQDLAVEEISGEMRVSRELDYERQNSYHLIAIPVNSHSNGETIYVTINVIDENDNAPTFPVSSINVSLGIMHELKFEIISRCCVTFFTP